MTALSYSQCYQAVRRHLRPRYDGIWVPDSLLESAFERYAATFRTGARHGSSVPGPMEHRKRLAKRHMGELHFGQSHSSAPIWELANLVDLTQWQWKPPTSPDRRGRSDTNTSEARTLSDALLSPLRSLFPPRTDTTDHGMLLPQDVILPGVAEPLSPGSWDIGSTPLDVIHTALESFSRDMANGTGVSSSSSNFYDGWRRALADGLFQAETIVQVLTGINDGLSMSSGHADGSRMVDQLKLLLMEATIEGVSQEKTGQATSFDHVAWNSILNGVSTIQINNIRVFAKAIACIPEQSLKEVSSGLMANLDAFFNALGRATARPTVIRQAAKMAVPLKSLGQLELRFILDNATQRVLQYADIDGMNYAYVRLSWLLLLARMPGVDLEYLAQVCNTLEAGISGPLNDSEVCHLFLVWANSQAPLEQYERLSRVLVHHRTDGFRRLSYRLWQTRQYYRVKHFSKLLHAIGRETHITSISYFRRLTRPCLLASIAIKMRRPQTAIDILCLYEECWRRKVSIWESASCIEALKILIWVPNFNHRQLWGALRIIPDKQLRNRRQRGQPERLNRIEVAKIATVGAVIGLSPYLSRRKAFSLMTNCYLNLRKHNAKLPRSSIRALLLNVTRPLADGEPGITSRLRYALHIIQQHMGRAQALRVGKEMEQWRRSNFGLK